MAARTDSTPGLEELQIKVVRLSDLGGRSTHALPKPPPAHANGPGVNGAQVKGHARPAPRPPHPAPGAAAPRPNREAAQPAPPAASAPAAAPARAAASAAQPAERTAKAPSMPSAAPTERAIAGAPAVQPEPAKRPAVPAPLAAAPELRRLFTTGKLSFVLVCAVLLYGWSAPTDRYINPNRGLGYALGIVGGSLMLLLLVYSLRKRVNWLNFLGSTPGWFRFHMVLGIVGPLCILYHSNFTTGAANSNVALFSMLIVAGSGLVGRYIYSHIHHGLYGRKLELGELRAGADGLRSLSGSISFLPELVTRIEAAEQRLLKAGPRGALLGFARPPVVALIAARARWRLHGYIRHALHASARQSAVVALEYKRLRATARAYVDRRLAATRLVATLESYERLFSLWHALHIPLMFMMIIAAVIHVIAVHVY